MRLPELESNRAGREQTDVFGGYNHNLRIGDGEFYDCENLSSENYPVLGVRKPRAFACLKSGLIKMPHNVTAAVYNNKWVFLDNSHLYYSYVDELVDNPSLINGYKAVQITDYTFNSNAFLVSFGAYVIAFPDGYYYNTVNEEDKGFIDTVAVSKSNNFLSFEVCDEFGKPMRKYIDEGKASTNKPENPSNGFIWIDGAEGKYHVYSDALKDWIDYAGTYYARLYMNGIVDNLVIGDFVTIRTNDNATDVIRAEQKKKYDKYIAGNKKIISVHKYDESTPETTDPALSFLNRDWFVVEVPGYFGSLVHSSYYTIERRLPKLDYVFECNNRLWGCRYGQQTDSAGEVVSDGVIVNAIYASALGDFKNWRREENTSMDSYEASVGEQGHFTGAIAYNGYPTFFKETCVYRVMGMYPAQYSITVESINGVALGAGRSLAIAGDRLYYQGRDGIYCYTGGQPVRVSDALGEYARHLGLEDAERLFRTQKDKIDAVEKKDEYFTYGNLFNLETDMKEFKSGPHDVDNFIGEIAGVSGRFYYIDKPFIDVMYAGNGAVRFRYDTENGMWHKESEVYPRARCATRMRGVTYTGSKEKTAYIPMHTYTFMPECEAWDGKKIQWFFETGAQGTTEPDKKFVSRINLRMQLFPGSRVMIYIQYDSAGDWQHCGTITGTVLRTYTLPIRLRRCDHYRLKLVGEGEMLMYSITKAIEGGSDL